MANKLSVVGHYLIVVRTKKSALAEGCVGLTLPNTQDSGFFFLSGDFYSLTQDKWLQFSRPEPAFNMFAIDNIPVILGQNFKVFFSLSLFVAN